MPKRGVRVSAEGVPETQCRTEVLEAALVQVYSAERILGQVQGSQREIERQSLRGVSEFMVRSH